MMSDLDNLKSAWKTISESDSKNSYSTDELKVLVKRRSNNELLKIKRKVKLEWLVGLFAAVILVLIVWLNKPEDTVYAIVFVGFIFALSIVPYWRIMKINEADHPNLKSYLETFFETFNMMVKQYVRLSTIVMPFAVIVGFLLGLHASLSDEKWEAMLNWQNVLFFSFFIVLLSFAGRWFQSFYFKFIYGKNIDRINTCLNDLNKTD